MANTQSLLRTNQYRINDTISIYVPTVGEIYDYGESEYYQIVQLLTSVPYDLMVQFDDMGVDYETISTTTGTVNKDEMSETEYVIIPSFAEEGLGSISVTLDATRLGPLGSAVNYLFSYPYGCIEQRASRLLPLVTFEEYIDVFQA